MGYFTYYLVHNLNTVVLLYKLVYISRDVKLGKTPKTNNNTKSLTHNQPKKPPPTTKNKQTKKQKTHTKNHTQQQTKQNKQTMMSFQL